MRHLAINFWRESSQPQIHFPLKFNVASTLCKNRYSQQNCDIFEKKNIIQLEWTHKKIIFSLCLRVKKIIFSLCLRVAPYYHIIELGIKKGPNGIGKCQKLGSIKRKFPNIFKYGNAPPPSTPESLIN